MSHHHDPLDVLLDRSAPDGLAADPLLRRQLAAMMDDARTTARPRRRPVRLAAIAGLAALLASGAGTAVAASVFDWEPWAQDPDITYPFTLPSGRACEARVAVYDASRDDAGRANDSAFARHIRGLDVIGAANLPASIAQVRQRDTSTSYVAVTPSGRLEDVHSTGSGPTEDDVLAAAVSDAVRDVLSEEAAAFGAGDHWTTDESILCEAVAP